MSIIDERVTSFVPISLDKMDEVKLLDRVDTKFVFGMNSLPGILEKLTDSYLILEISNVRMQRYETLYFDTPELKCYLDHHNKRSNRFKVRSRRYVDTGVCYFEVKMKSNKGRTTKERKKQKGEQHEIQEKHALILKNCTSLMPEHLAPCLWVDFSRITLVDRGMQERITLDTGLTFRMDGEERTFPGIVIAEIKQNRSHTSGFRQILRQHFVRELRISKYCLGMASMHRNIKQNYFKEKFQYIKKVQHDLS